MGTSLMTETELEFRRLDPALVQLKVKVRYTGEWKLRFRIFRGLIWLLAWLGSQVMGMGLEFEDVSGRSEEENGDTDQ